MSLLIHNRTYDVASYRESPTRIRLSGSIHDRKPPGHYFPGDPEELDIHLMEIDLELEFPSLEIVSAKVVMEVVPHSSCGSIASKYDQLVGLSIARGFSRRVKELFGGPQGCTHIGALLAAMAPVAVQSMWSMKRLLELETPVSIGESDESTDQASVEEARRAALKFNIDSCHIWASDGPAVQAVMNGDEFEIPLWASQRLDKLGRPHDEWLK